MNPTFATTSTRSGGISLEVFYVVLGVILGFLLTVLWDRYKEYEKYKEMIRLILDELERNENRMDDVYNNLSANIKEKFAQSQTEVKLTDADMNNVAWSFPKPYVTDAWKAFVASGLISRLPIKKSQKLYQLYDQINSINFLSDLSINLFQILANENKLDQETNKNFDRFCRTGTLSLQVAARSLIKETISKLK